MVVSVLGNNPKRSIKVLGELEVEEIMQTTS